MNIEFRLIRNRVSGIEIGIDDEMLHDAVPLPDGGLRLAPEDCEPGESNLWDVVRQADEPYPHDAIED
jgi:hypothetical protein